MKKPFRMAIATVCAVATAFCVASCGKQKPTAADTAAVDSLVGAVLQEQADSAAAANANANANATDLSQYNADYFAEGGNYTTTPSGLKYVVVTEGTGAAPTAADIVTVHYTGRLLDGTVFDSSVQRGEPASFPLRAVIPGWTEGLQLMKTGGTTVFYIPSNLAYGEMGTPGGPIGPNSDLIFEVQLLGINQTQQ